MQWFSSHDNTICMKSCMTESPRCLDANCHLITAKQVMNELGVRHIPITERGRLVGVLSDRDIRSFERSYAHRGIKDVRIKEVCLFEPYAVTEDEPLGNVLSRMIEHKIGSVVVERNGIPVGIFTTLDVCKLLKRRL